MQFAYSEDQELLRDSTRRFLRDRCPIAAVRAGLDAPDRFDREVWRLGAALGWTAFLVPEQHGGGSLTDQPHVDLAAVAEELGRELYPGPVLATNVVADLLAREGSPELQQRYLASIVRGELSAAWCLTSSGSAELDDIAVELTEGPTGPDRSGASTDLRLDGITRFVVGASVADLLLVCCAGPRGPALAIVVPPSEGLYVRAMRGIDITRDLCEVRFDDVAVPAANLVVGSGPAAAAIERALQLATVVQSAEVVGAGEALLERTVQYAKERVQFGRPIGSFQALKHRMADMLIELEGARAATRYAALALADNREDCDEAVAVAGSYVREAIAHLCGESLQLHGGVGFTWEHDTHLYLRRVKSEQALYGEPWWHRERLCLLTESRTPEPRVAARRSETV